MGRSTVKGGEWISRRISMMHALRVPILMMAASAVGVAWAPSRARPRSFRCFPGPRVRYPPRRIPPRVLPHVLHFRIARQTVHEDLVIVQPRLQQDLQAPLPLPPLLQVPLRWVTARATRGTNQTQAKPSGGRRLILTCRVSCLTMKTCRLITPRLCRLQVDHSENHRALGERVRARARVAARHFKGALVTSATRAVEQA